eukprot:Rmarinus@m.29016
MQHYGSSLPPWQQAQAPEPQWPSPHPPPADPELTTVINNMVGFVMRNGPSFEDLMRQKRQGDPKFQFLFGGEHSGYYQWRLSCARNGWSDETIANFIQTNWPQSSYPSQGQPFSQQPQQSQPHPHPHSHTSHIQRPASLTMQRGDWAAWERLVSALSGSKESIKGLKAWILDHKLYAKTLSKSIREKVEQCGEDFDTKIHFVYVINDVLHNCKARRDKGDVSFEPLQVAIGEQLARILWDAMHNPRPDNESEQKILKVILLWKNREIFSPETMSAIEGQIFGDDPPEVPSEDEQPPVSAGPASESIDGGKQTGEAGDGSGGSQAGAGAGAG